MPRKMGNGALCHADNPQPDSCRRCYIRLHMRRWTAKHPERAKAQNRKAQEKRRADPIRHERDKQRAKQWRIDNVEMIQGHRLKKYGMTYAEYQFLLQQQHGGCAICSTAVPRGNGGFHVDHDHVTGKIRGLLCHSCNTAIGLLCHDTKLLQLSIVYLTKQLPEGTS